MMRPARRGLSETFSAWKIFQSVVAQTMRTVASVIRYAHFASAENHLDFILKRCRRSGFSPLYRMCREPEALRGQLRKPAKEA